MLEDQVVIVTGASAGIGYATAELLASEGAHVVAAARGEIPHAGLTAVQVDLTTPDGPQDLADAALDLLGRPGTAEEVARVIAFLVSPLSAQVTGAEWAIDGGALREL